MGILGSVLGIVVLLVQGEPSGSVPWPAFLVAARGGEAV